MKTRNVMFMCLCLGLALSLRAAEKREYSCYPLTNAPVLDGNITAEEWGDIPEAGGFYILGKEAMACRSSSFKAGWTPQAIYLAVRCYEPTPSLIKADSKNGDNIWGDDSVELFFQPAGAAQYLQFVANTIGARWNAKGLDNWQAKANVGDESWTLEIMIPFSLLGKTPAAADRWLFNIARNNNSDSSELHTSWPQLKAGFADVANYAGLVFKDGRPGKDEIAAIQKTITIIDPKASAVTFDAAMQAGMTSMSTGVKQGGNLNFEGAFRLATNAAQKAQALLYVGHCGFSGGGFYRPAGVRGIYERVLAIKDAPADTLADAQNHIAMLFAREMNATAAKEAWEKVIAMPGVSAALVSEALVGIAGLEIDAKNYAAAGLICQRVLAMPGASGTAVNTAKQKLEIIKILDGLKTVSREALLGYYAHEPLAVTATNVMPNIQWLKPGQQTKLRVLFITYLDGIREVAQIAQRMELEPGIAKVAGQDTFLFKDYGEKYPIYNCSSSPGFDDGQPAKEVAKEIERVLDSNYDALVLGAVNWSSFPQTTREKILKKVESGSTLIAKVSGMDDLLTKALKDRIKPDLSFLFPFKGLPAFSKYSDFQAFLENTVQISKLGQGRIILLTGYDVPDYQMLTPGVSGNPDDLKLVDYDYYLAFIIHLLRYASGKEADCRISGQPLIIQANDYRWKFNRTADMAGWRLESLADKGVTDGVWKLEATQEKPMIFTPRVEINATDQKRVVFSMQLGKNEGIKSGCFLFITEDQPQWSDKTIVSFEVKADGEMHDYEVDMSKNPLWKGKVVQLRFHPFFCQWPVKEEQRMVTLKSFGIPPQAAANDPARKVSGQSALETDRAAAFKLGFELESKVRTNAICSLAVRDRDNRIWATQEQAAALTSGKQTEIFMLDKLPAGGFFVDLKVRDGDKVMDFGSSWMVVTSSNNIAAVAIKGEYGRKEKVKGKVSLVVNGQEKDLKLHIARRDNYTRVVSRVELPVNGPELSFSLPAAEGVLSGVQYLDVELRKGVEILDLKTVSFRVKPEVVSVDNRHAVLPETAGKDSYLAPYLSADYERCGSGRVLNNFVTELLNVSEFGDDAIQTFTFENPRDGWVFAVLSADSKKEEDRAWVLLGSDRELRSILTVSGSSKKEATAETMRYLPAGKYTLAVGTQGKTKLKHVTVRAVPELHFADYPFSYGDTHLKRFYRINIDSWDFMRSHILSNINVIIGVNTLNNSKTALDWKKTGGKWIARSQVPKYAPENGMPTVDEAYKFWALGDLENPLVDGLIADEFTIAHLTEQQQKFEVYCAALKQINDNQLYQGKMFYPYIGVGGNARFFQSTFRHISAMGFKMALETYLNEMNTRDQAAQFITDAYDLNLEPFLEVCPTPQKHIVHVYCPDVQSVFVLDILPDIDFKVFLDMQFNYMANAPACAGLYSLSPFLCDFADEETMRWIARLYRHYGIEGKRTMLSTDPYELTHLRNADFEKGLEDWKITAAEEGGIKVMTIPKIAGIESRDGWLKDKGECLWMKRSAKAPNRFSQTVKNLAAGRLYALKFFTYDLQGKEKNPEKYHALSVTLDNAELLKNLETPMRAGSGGDGKWLNLHYYVFRAKSDAGNLTISDWADDKNPGGPVEQEIVYDFIQIQPYLE